MEKAIFTIQLLILASMWVLVYEIHQLLKKELTHLADGLTDLKQAVTDLNTSVSNELTAIGTALQNASQNSGGVSQADAETIVGQLRDLQTRIDQETSALANPVQTAAQTQGTNPPVA